MEVDEEQAENMANGNGVEYLDGPTISPKDENQYRVVKLSNGLVAVLIKMIGDPHDLDRSAASNDSPIQETNQASYSLHINVGTFSDPWDVPGLNATIVTIIQESFGGNIEIKFASGDCTVECDETTFYVPEINHDNLCKEMDRFVQTLIGPIQSCTIVRSIRSVIEAVMLYRYKNSTVKSNRFFTDMIRPDHPASKLSDKVSEAFRSITEDRLREEIDKFRERHYSAHRMTLFVKARLPFNEMEECVKKCFSKIPNNGLPPDDFGQFNDVDPFDPQRYRRVYKLEYFAGPQASFRENSSYDLELSWVMPSLIRHYRTKPLGYLSSLITRKREGSLLHYLKTNDLCEQISTNSSEIHPSRVVSNSLYTEFKITMSLTNKGSENMKQVLDSVFSYINLIRREGPQSRPFEELKKIQEIKFRRAKKGIEQTYDKVFLGYPPADMLTGDHLYFDYDPKAIQACLDRWTPDRMNVIVAEYGEIVSLNVVEDMYEHLYNKNSSGEYISEDWIEHWRTIEPLPDYHYLHSNPFVADDFSLIPINNDGPNFPVKIHSDEFMDVWWKPCVQTPLVNDTYINCHWISPLPYASAENTAMLDVFCKTLNHFVAEDLVIAANAGYSYYPIESNYQGMWVEASGPSQNLPLLLKRISKCLTESPFRITEEIFNAGKREILKLSYMSDNEVAQDLLKSMRYKVHWTKIDAREAILNVDYRKFNLFAKGYVECLCARYLVQGNMTSDDAIETAKSCFKILNYRPILPETFPEKEEIVIPRGVHCYRVSTPSSFNYVVNLYQFPDVSFKLSAMLEFFRMIAEPDAGGDPEWVNDYGMAGCYFDSNSYTLCAEEKATRDKVYRIDRRIEKFREYLRQRLTKESEEEFLETKKQLMKTKMKQCTESLFDEVQYNWKQIASGDCSFDRRQREFRLIGEMSSAEFRGWMLKFTMPATDSHTRKISVQTVESSLALESLEFEKDSESRVLRESYNSILQCKSNFSVRFVAITSAERSRNRATGKPVTDIEAFKRNLAVLTSVGSTD